MIEITRLTRIATHELIKNTVSPDAMFDPFNNNFNAVTIVSIIKNIEVE